MPLDRSYTHVRGTVNTGIRSTRGGGGTYVNTSVWKQRKKKRNRQRRGGAEREREREREREPWLAKGNGIKPVSREPRSRPEHEHLFVIHVCRSSRLFPRDPFFRKRDAGWLRVRQLPPAGPVKSRRSHRAPKSRDFLRSDCRETN